MPPTDEELLESAQQLHDQAEYLLNDEVSYAESLRDARKTSTTLVLLVAGVGLFRFDLFRHTQQVLIVPELAATIIRCLFLAAIACLLVGAYLVYTERGLLREFVGDHLFMLDDAEQSEADAPIARSPPQGGALSILHLKQEVLDDFMQKPPIEVVRMKTDGLRLAYTRLKKANRRVRKRLAGGTVLVFVGLFIVLAAFGIYTVTVDLSGAVHTAKGGSNAPQAVPSKAPGSTG